LGRPAKQTAGSVIQLDTSAIATRYDKLAKTFLAGVQLACATILLK
jgi:hypothetical protein